MDEIESEAREHLMYAEGALRTVLSYFDDLEELWKGELEEIIKFHDSININEILETLARDIRVRINKKDGLPEKDHNYDEMIRAKKEIIEKVKAMAYIKRYAPLAVLDAMPEMIENMTILANDYQKETYRELLEIFNEVRRKQALLTPEIKGEEYDREKYDELFQEISE